MLVEGKIPKIGDYLWQSSSTSSDLYKPRRVAVTGILTGVGGGAHGPWSVYVSHNSGFSDWNSLFYTEEECQQQCINNMKRPVEQLRKQLDQAQNNLKVAMESLVPKDEATTEKICKRKKAAVAVQA